MTDRPGRPGPGRKPGRALALTVTGLAAAAPVSYTHLTLPTICSV